MKKNIYKYLSTYRPKPINNHTARSVGWAPADDASRESRGTKRFNPPGSPSYVPPTETTITGRRQCPICGKLKLGLDQHMRAVHGVTQHSAVFPVTDGSTRLDGYHSTSHPALSGPRTSSPPSSEPPSPAAELDPIPRSKKAGTHCPVCMKMFIRLGVHLAKTHELTLVQCPNCLEDQALKPGGKRRCSSCQRYMTLTRAGRLAGRWVLCGSCSFEFYTEKLGFQRCYHCSSQCIVDSNGVFEFLGGSQCSLQ